MPLTNAEKCKNYRKRKKDSALKIKTTPKTPAQRAQMHRLRKKQLTQKSLNENEVLYAPLTSNSQTLEPSSQPVNFVFKMPSRNALRCKNYRKRKKDAALKTKKTPKTPVQRTQKKQRAQGSLNVNEVFCTPPSSNLQTFEPLPQPVITVSESPIMQFFKRLIVNNSSQNTILTNAQIHDLLTKEFHFDLSKLHELEIEIYINVLKKYLKDWPIWVDFDHTAKLLTSQGDEESLSKLLEDRYENLKSYLQSKLDIAKPLAMECVAKIKNKQENLLKQESDLYDSDNMVLEIQATREQLNTLFLRYPDAQLQNTIFKYSDSTIPKHITLNTLSLEAILNWWSVVVTINLQWLPGVTNMFLKRETVHKLDHMLVNRKVEKPSLVTSLDSDIQIKTIQTKPSPVSSRQLQDCLDSLKRLMRGAGEEMRIILDCLKRDLTFLSVCLAPAQFRRFYCKYPYVRYLYENTDDTHRNHRGKYDIQLKEILSPMHLMAIGKLDGYLDKTLPDNWLKIDCGVCNKTFMGDQLAEELRQHFDEYHQNEPDWQCTNCQKTFSMAYLASEYWCHDCV